MRDGLVDAIAAGRLSERRLNEAAARMVALAGGDPRAVSCVDVDLPRMQPAPVPVTATTRRRARAEVPDEAEPVDPRRDQSRRGRGRAPGERGEDGRLRPQ